MSWKIDPIVMDEIHQKRAGYCFRKAVRGDLLDVIAPAGRLFPNRLPFFLGISEHHESELLKQFKEMQDFKEYDSLRSLCKGAERLPIKSDRYVSYFIKDHTRIELLDAVIRILQESGDINSMLRKEGNGVTIVMSRQFEKYLHLYGLFC